MSWSIRPCEDERKRLKKLAKKWKKEVVNVYDNLDTLLDALNHGAKPEQLKSLGFVHSEPYGILAIDQTGPGKGSKLKELRLYVYPHEEKEELYTMILGDKSTQHEDIKLSRVFVSGLLEQAAARKEAESEAHTEDDSAEESQREGQ